MSLREKLMSLKPTRPWFCRKPKLGIKGLMMAEIFLNALVIAYAIYHTAVVFGWTLLLFDIYNDTSEKSSCPECPAVPFFVHGVSTTSLLGLALWIFGYLIDFSGNKSREEAEQRAKEEEEKKKAGNEITKSENPSTSTSPPQIIITGASDTTDGAAQTAVIAAVTSAAQSAPEENAETTDDKAPLIQPKQVLEFRFLFAHLTCLGLGVIHMGWMAFGTFLTIPMYFRLNLYSEGLEASACNATIYWFAILIVLFEYLLLFTLTTWFTIDVIIIWRRKKNIEVQSTATVADSQA